MNDLHIFTGLGLCLISFRKSRLVKYVALSKITGLILAPGIYYY